MREFGDFLKNRQKANLAMVLINIIVFIVLEISGSTQNTRFMLDCGAAYTPLVLEGQYWRLFTSMFLHFGFEHLAYNMFSLLFMGDILESVVGPVRYLVIYLAGGLGGNLLSLLVSMRSGKYAVSAGASGAVFACMGGILYISLLMRSRIGREGIRRLGMVAALMIMQGFVDRGVDGTAHIGGLIAGFIFTALLYHPDRRTSRQL